MTNRISLNSFILGAALLSFSACSDDDGPTNGSDGINALLDIVTISAGDICSDGGYSVNSGADINGNGILDADEVTSTATTCNGESGTEGSDGNDGSDAALSLVKQTELPAGDENCPGSGVRVDVGVDNGDGGGTANDGILQEGEVDDFAFVCNGANFVEAKPVTPPEGPAGAFTMIMNGGDGSDGEGGAGGYVKTEITSGTMGGHNKIFSTGVADASFEMPATVDIYLGDHPLVVSSELIVKSYDDDSTVDAGEVHMHTGGQTGIYMRDATNTFDVEVTGLKIENGATLTLMPNNSAHTSAKIYLENDFHNAGTLRTSLVEGTNNRASCDIQMDTYYGEVGSVIDLSGLDGDASVDGGNGGTLTLSAQDEDINTDYDGGLIVNYSTVDITGGDGAKGGAGGDVKLESFLTLYNAGDIDASGGVGLSARGGTAGVLDIYGMHGHCYNSARLKADGGAGLTGGGAGNEIYLWVNGAGDIRNSGEISGNGGDVDDACTVSCSAGNAADLEFYSEGGDIINHATLTLRGGATKMGLGGVGGDFKIKSATEWAQSAVGDIFFSGNIDLSGGSGVEGSAGGGLSATLYGGVVPQQQEIIFLGYTDIYANGGNGENYGGDGGYLEMLNEDASPDYGENGPGGGNINYANFHANGGTAVTDDGGNGGYFKMDGDDRYGALTDGLVALNYGALNINGGDGVAGGGMGGWVYMWGYNRAENHGAIMAASGDASDDGITAGSCDDGVRIYSDLGPAINTGNIDTSGGLASGAASIGGNGGIFELVGHFASNSGAISVKGGNSSDAEGVGGDADNIFIYGVLEGSTNTGTFNVDGGTATTLGAHGEVVIDGMNMTDSWYTE